MANDEKPAMVREHAELRIMAQEIKEAVKIGDKAKAEGAQAYRRAGIALIKAKAVVPHGQWISWVEQTLGQDRRTAARWMALAKCDVTSHLDAQWSIINGNTKIDEEPTPPAESEQVACPTCNRPYAEAVSVGKFVKPTVEQVAAHCQGRNNGLDAEAFVAFYESKGWKVGNSPMKSWQHAIITWEKRNPKQEDMLTQFKKLIGDGNGK